MTRMFARFCLLAILTTAVGRSARALDPSFPTAAGAEETQGGPQVKPLNYPADLRAFRGRAIKADGFFVPDIALSILTCPSCRKPYVFGVYPRLTRAPYDSLASVQRSIEESLKKPVPKVMYSPRAGKAVPRACPYCGEPEREPRPDKVYFCHFLADTGEDLHIEYTIADGKPADRTYWRVSSAGDAKQVSMFDESERAFKSGFDCHFSLRAVWNDIFAAHWNDDKVHYENPAPGVYLIFRPEKVGDIAFKEFADTRLKADRDKGLFSRLESPLKVDTKQGPENTILTWSPEFAERFANGKAECFVGLSLPELRKAAGAAAKSRKSELVLNATDKPNIPGTGFLERGPLKMGLNLAPLVKLTATAGLSLHQACSLFMGEGSYTLEAAERLNTAIQASLPGCSFEIKEGAILIARDPLKQERRIDLVQIADKVDPNDAVIFGIFGNCFFRWDAQRGAFGPAPLERELSPIGMPAFIERRIRPAEFTQKGKFPNALFEAYFDKNGKRCDICYTSECTATVVYVDPKKERFKDIPDVDTARRLAFAEGGTLPLYIENQDGIRFPGGVRGMLEFRAPIFFGTDVSSMAAEAERASALADFGGLPDVTERIHFYAFTTHCAALAPRKLTPDEFELLRSRATNLIKENRADPGLDLNLYFDLPRTTPKGKVLRRKK